MDSHSLIWEMSADTEQPIAKSLLWHPDLHAYYSEELYYIGLRFSGYNREVIEAVKGDLSEFDLKGTCAYEVFGEYDVLLRVWVPLGSFVRDVLPALDRYENLMTRHVMKVSEAFHWPFPKKPSEAGIGELGGRTDTIRKIQDNIRRKGKAHTEISQYVNAKLSYYGAIGKAESTKFFTSLNFQDRPNLSRAQERSIRTRLRRAYEACLGDDGPVTNVSIYLGDGFAYAMIKGLVNTVQEARDFVLDITRDFDGLKPFTSTYMVCEIEPLEEDYLSDSAFARFSVGTSPWVQTWFSELYRVAGDPDLVQSVTNLLVSNRQSISELPMDSTPGRDLFKGLLLAVVKRDPAIAMQVVLPWFASIEHDLARNWMPSLRAISELQGKDLEQEDFALRKELKLMRESGFPRIPLGDWLKLYLAALAKHVPESRLLERKVQPAELTKIRNAFAHGDIIANLEKLWAQAFETMLWYAPLHQDLMDLAENPNTLEVSSS